MHRSRVVVASLAVHVLLTSGAGAADPPRRYPGQTTESYVRHLEDPDRAAWQKPREVVAALAIAKGATVADVGSGSGYFLPFLAEAVGDEGQVLALDADPAMVRVLEKRIAAEGLKNVTARRVEPGDPGLAPASVDRIFLCDVWPQLGERTAYARKLVQALRPGGRIAIVDYHRREDVPYGPPLADKVARATVLAEIDAAGLDLAAEHDLLPYQYFLELRPRGAPTIESLAAGVAKAIAEEKDPDLRTKRVAAELGTFLKEGDLPARFRTAHPGIDVTTYLLYVPPDASFSIAALVIRPHAKAPMHDHRTWTVWGTIQGHDHEVQFDRSGDPDQGFPELTLRVDHVLQPGDVSIVPDPPRDVHQVENAGEDVSVSIHVHGADMSQITRHRYDREHGRVLSFVQSYDRPN